MIYITGILTLVIALNGILFQPKNNLDKPLSFKNLNKYGLVLIGMLFLLTFMTIYKQRSDKVSAEKSDQQKNYQIEKLLEQQDQLISGNKDLKEFNQYIIKAINVSDGYDLLVNGEIVFQKSINDKEIRYAIENLFNKGAEINLIALNKFGEFEGKISYSNTPEIRKYLNLNRRRESSEYSFEFELRFENVKILSSQGIPFVKLSEDDEFHAIAKEKITSMVYQDIYKVKYFILTGIEIEELNKRQTLKLSSKSI